VAFAVVLDAAASVASHLVLPLVLALLVVSPSIPFPANPKTQQVFLKLNLKLNLANELAQFYRLDFLKQKTNYLGED